MTEHSEFVARDLVRSFSNSLKGPDSIVREISSPRLIIEGALQNEVDLEDEIAGLLRLATASQHNSASLTARYQELEAALGKFQNAFQDKHLEVGELPALSWSSLTHRISQLKTQYDGKAKKNFQGQAKRKFHSVCETINNHSNVLKMLPHGDKYTSLICGSLETIIKASVNHEQVGEDFTVAWKEIDKVVAATKRELLEYPQPFLLELSVELCCKILEFVTFFFSWYTQKGHKRFLASLNENLAKEYQPHLDEIRTISSFIQRGVQFSMARDGREQAQERERYFREVQEFHQRENWRRNEEQWELLHRACDEHYHRLHDKMEQYLANMSQRLGIMFDQPPGKGIKQILNHEANRFVAAANKDRQIGATRALAVEINEDLEDMQGSAVTIDAPSRADVDSASKILDPFFNYDQVHPVASGLDCFIEAEAIQRLQTWNSHTTSSILGIFGPVAFSSDNAARLLASNYVHAAKAAGIPCISYFCALSLEMPPRNRTRETIGTVALLYALVKQLIRYLPLTSSMTGDRFESLDGTFRTWPLALSLFHDLLVSVDVPILLIVVYGLEVLDHTATRARLTAILKELRGAMSDGAAIGHQRTVFKVLFATSGLSHILDEGLEVAEIYDMNGGRAAHSPGQAKKGRQSMNGVLFS
ncbi:hypothetical protein BKA66DRAFT_466879 [Pyrenochaeta sp. MPI-SDFR-AT-0127]|nr:hypothetical protein BKA66DRAFT_466879 [Pyrenochaeta sp. MPI-SDFR-AT-0127]